MVPNSDVAGLGGIGGGGGKGRDAGKEASSLDSVSPTGKGGGGGGGGIDESMSSDSPFAASLDEPSTKGIIGPTDDLYMGGFPGGGAPVGFH